MQKCRPRHDHQRDVAFRLEFDRWLVIDLDRKQRRVFRFVKVRAYVFANAFARHSVLPDGRREQQREGIDHPAGSDQTLGHDCSSFSVRDSLPNGCSVLYPFASSFLSMTLLTTFASTSYRGWDAGVAGLPLAGLFRISMKTSAVISS